MGGGDSTLLLHEGKKFEDAHAKDGSLPDPNSTDNAEFKCVLATIKASIASDKQRFNKWVNDMVGVSEETTTGVHRLISMADKGTLLFPAINAGVDIVITTTGNKDIITLEHVQDEE